MLTIMKRIRWWGVVNDKVLVCASAGKEDVVRVGVPIPITIQYPIEEVTTPERMFEVFDGIKVSDAKYSELMAEAAANNLRFEQEMGMWMAENNHWQMVRATLGSRMFDEFVNEVKQWIYDHM